MNEHIHICDILFLVLIFKTADDIPCVAMLAGVTVEDVVSVMNNDKGTGKKDIEKALNHYGIAATLWFSTGSVSPAGVFPQPAAKSAAPSKIPVQHVILYFRLISSICPAKSMYSQSSPAKIWSLDLVL